MFTRAAGRTLAAEQSLTDTVFTLLELVALGCTRSQIAARVAARRWQRVGRAIVLHSGDLTDAERWRIALIHCGPRSVLASFTALQSAGMTGWTRDSVHVLGPAGVGRPQPLGFPIALHRARSIPDNEVYAARRIQRPAPALVMASSSFTAPRPAIGVLAAGVQQRLVRAEGLRDALNSRPTLPHRGLLLAAVKDIAMGPEALSEIDFARLCRRHRLPQPEFQAVRAEAGGRRRYLDASFRRTDGRTVAVEVDGAIHLAAERWFADQLRQNEVVIGIDALMLRFPSFVVRTDETLVASQLRRILWL